MAIPGIQNAWNRIVRRNGKPPYVVVTGTTSGTANTQLLVTHGLTDDVGKALKPSVVIVVPTAATPAGFTYAVTANTTSTQLDVRATGASVAFAAICIA